MITAEQGYLLLCTNFGDGIPPLSPTKRQAINATVPLEELLRQPLTDRLLQSLHMDPKLAEELMLRLRRTDMLNSYLRQAAEQGIEPLSFLSPDYPARWKKHLGKDAPGALYLRGDRSLLGKPAISLVGSRKLHSLNAVFARRIGRMAAEEGYVLVSGNARGADSTAQQGCLDAGGSVISITPESLESLRPRPNQLLISADGFQLGFSSGRAISRNHLIHSLGEMVFVAQVSDHAGGTWSGSTHNLRHELSPLYVFRDNSAGADALIELGATPVSLTVRNLHDLAPAQSSFFA